MNLSLPKTYNNKIVKAIAEFDLIHEGDRILIGASGGKDSTFLLYGLKILQKNLGINFDLAAITVDLGFDRKNNIDRLKEYCKKLDLTYYVKKTDIADYILQEKKENPCAKCAYFRKGALTTFMKKKGFNKIAYGHHYDDAVITFLMSIFYSGQLKTFQPRQFLSHNKITVIRPLVYLREKEIVEGKKITGYEPPSSPCPFDGNSQRDKVKEQFRDFIQDKQIFYNIVASMREGDSPELWPEPPESRKIGFKMRKLWQDNK